MFEKLFKKSEPADGSVQMVASVEELVQSDSNEPKVIDIKDDNTVYGAAAFPEDADVKECFKYVKSDMSAPVVSKDFKYQLDTIYYRNGQEHGFFGYAYVNALIKPFLSNLKGKSSYRFFSGQGVERTKHYWNDDTIVEFDYLRLEKEFTQRELFDILKKKDRSEVYFVNTYEDLEKSFDESGNLRLEILLKPQIDELIECGYSEAFATYLITHRCIRNHMTFQSFDQDVFTRAVVLGRENISPDVRALILLT